MLPAERHTAWAPCYLMFVLRDYVLSLFEA